MSEGLKPCPFCRRSGDALMELCDKFDAGHTAHIHCMRCGANGPSEYSEKGWDEALKLAREKWNVRNV